jgi:hypothetical protein
MTSSQNVVNWYYNIALAGLIRLYNFEINFIFNQVYISKRVIVKFMLTIY